MNSKAQKTLDLVISGAAGRMGRTLLQIIGESSNLRLAGALEKSDSKQIGEPVSSVVGSLETKLELSSAPETVLSEEKILIDFTRPEATEKLVETAHQTHTPAVIGTTGLSSEIEQKIETLSQDVPVVKAANMSVGINLLLNLVGEATQSLGPDYDVEIMEMHHRFKEDAPSGTANMLANKVAETRDQQLDEVSCSGRKGFTGERDSDEIGVMSLRGGDVVGDHSVIFAGIGERLKLTHKASSRETFARGALRAAKFISTASPGLYDMQDVLGLS